MNDISHPILNYMLHAANLIFKREIPIELPMKTGQNKVNCARLSQNSSMYKKGVHRLQTLISFLHQPFAGIIPLQTFRYGITGSINTGVDLVLYYVSYHYVFDGQNFELPFATISPHIAAFMLSFCFTFFLGFILNRTIAFSGSVLRKRVQLFRYIIVVACCIILNYIFLKLFVEQMQFLPMVAKLMTTIIVIIFSYFMQKHFTFKMEKI